MICDLLITNYAKKNVEWITSFGNTNPTFF